MARRAEQGPTTIRKRIAEGTVSYNVDSTPVLARGVVLSKEELDNALRNHVSETLWDEEGRIEIKTLLGALATTEFQTKHLQEVLETEPYIEDWRVGEAIAAAYLEAHRSYFCPWPSCRDLKNPAASPAGADFVGFCRREKVSRFAFGEAKTSSDKNTPPAAVTSRSGLSKQLENLRDSSSKKNALFCYLAHRASGKAWYDLFREASTAFLSDETDIFLFGMLVRDTEPNSLDLKSRAIALSNNCPKQTKIELYSIYIPNASVGTLSGRVKTAREEL